jgi:hypothetical protein
MRQTRKSIEQPAPGKHVKEAMRRRATKKRLVELAKRADRIRELYRRGPREKWWIPDQTKDANITVKFTESDWEFVQEVRLVPEGVWERAAKTPSENCRIMLEGYVEQYFPPIPEQVLEDALDHRPNNPARDLVISRIVEDSQLDHLIERLEEADSRRVEGLRRELSFRVGPWHFAKLKEIARFLKLKHTRQRTRKEAGHVRIARLLISDMVRWARGKSAKRAAA